ncbi:MAG: thymidylate kinase [Planctomycetaceae bacterium]
MAFLVAIEGIDGSGKGTQATRLHERLDRAGKRAALISFPRYKATLFGKAVGDFLNGRFGTLENVSPFLVALLYAGDRFESRGLLLDSMASNEVVILDRYVPSNLAHQGAKVTSAERARLIEWVSEIEYGIYRLPRADLTFLLDLPVADAQRLIAQKQSRQYTPKKADIQEADAGYLDNVRGVYRDLAAAEPNWYRVDCLAGSSLRSVDEISDEIWNVLASHSKPA